MTTEIVVKFQFEGVHSWPECPHEDVAFLRVPHRHVFHVTATAKEEESREIEIIRFKRQMECWTARYLTGPHKFSCEDMAKRLIDAFNLSSCTVLEDNENGAIVRV